MRKTARSVKRPTPWTTAGAASGKDEPASAIRSSRLAGVGVQAGVTAAAIRGACGDAWESAPPRDWQQSRPIALHVARCDALIGHLSESQRGVPNSRLKLLSTRTAATQRQRGVNRLIPAILRPEPNR